MNLPELEGIAAQALDAARRHGADDADCVVVQSSSLNVTCRLGALEDIERSETLDLGLRTFAGRRQANISTTDFSKASLDRLAERCCAMARAAPEDPYCGLADKADLAADIKSFDLHDGTSLPADRLRALALEAEDTARATKGIANSLGASAGFGTSGMVLATSTGFAGSYRSTSYSISCSVLAGEGTAMERDYDYDQKLHFGDLKPAREIGQLAAERTLKRLGPRQAKSQAVPVIFDPRVSGGLVRHFAGAISGQAVARGTSFLKDSLGKQVFAKGIGIIDDPHRKRGLRTRPFDGEGLATRRTDMISDGMLQGWFLDLASARQLDLAPTGHASRSIGTAPVPAPSNLYMAAGKPSREDLIGQVDNGFYVTDLIGMGVNGVTGDYSRGAQGFWIENGELTYPVSEITIAGNLKDIYLNLTPGNDLEFRYGTDAPSVLVEGLTIAGA
jgi:PmbA protein